MCSAIAHSDLAEQDNVSISMQLLGLCTSTSDDDPTLRKDWRSYCISERTIQVPGRFVEPIDPEIMAADPTSTFYLFQGTFLVATAATILGLVTKKNMKTIPEITSSAVFPYHECTGMCVYECDYISFLCDYID